MLRFRIGKTRFMAMRYQQALHGILFSIIVTASIFMGISAISQNNTEQRAFSVSPRETMQRASEEASVPTWAQINHTRLTIDTSEAPRASVTGVAGVAVGTLERKFNKKTSVNATNIQQYMNLSYTDGFSINCTNGNAASNFTVRLNTPLIFAWYRIGVFNINWQAIKIRCPTNQTSFTPADIRTGSPLNPLIVPNVTQFDNRTQHFNFNISQAVRVFESTSIYTGATFWFEVNFTVTVTFSSWSMATKPGKNFRMEGNQSTRQSNYTLSFRVSGPKGVNITFHYFLADRNYTSNHIFYQNNVLFTPTYDATLKGWKIAPGGSVKLNSTGLPFKIEFTGNATVGFVEQKAGRWNSDGMASRLDTRTRKFKLAVLSGPSTLLIERVEFTANDIAYSSVFQSTNKVAPTSSITVTDDTYHYYDPVLERDVTRSNGTKTVIGRIQKANGSVTVSFNYNASYSALLTVRDDVRNLLSGAEVTLYFHGVRFGPLMSVNGTSLQPVKITNALGEVAFDHLPEGNYSVEVRFQGLVKTQEFSLYGGAKSVPIDVVTNVPYQPWILVAWLGIFGTVCALGIVLFKRKR
jgi:hypothetical protein